MSGLTTILTRYFSGLDKHMREVLSSASISFIFRVLGAAAQFCFTVVLARLFGAEGMGAYVLALSIVAVGSTLGRWGVDQAALKYISVYADCNKWNGVVAVYQKSIGLILVSSIIVSILLFLLVPWLANSIFHEAQLQPLLKIMSLSIVPFSLLNLLAECLRALKKIGAHTLVQGLLVPALSSIFLILFYFTDAGLSGAAYAYVITTYIVFAIGYILWKNSIPKTAEIAQYEIISAKNLIHTANPMAWVTLVSIIISFAETFLLGIFRNAEEVGIYAVALRLALLVNFVIVAFNSILAPKFAALYQQGLVAEIQRLVGRSVLAMLVFTLPLFIIYFIFPGFALQLFGQEFIDAGPVLLILSSAQLVNICAGPAAVLLMMTGYEKHMRCNVFISFFFGLAIGLLLIPTFGVLGAACSASFGIVLLNILAVRSVRKVIDIHMPLSHFLFRNYKT